MPCLPRAAAGARQQQIEGLFLPSANLLPYRGETISLVACAWHSAVSCRAAVPDRTSRRSVYYLPSRRYQRANKTLLHSGVFNHSAVTEDRAYGLSLFAAVLRYVLSESVARAYERFLSMGRVFSQLVELACLETL